MEEKKKLKVNYSASKKVGDWQAVFGLFGWLFFVGGIITFIVGIVNASDYHGETTTLTVGAFILASAFVFWFNSAVLRGIETLVQSAEYKKAIVESEYEVVEKEKQSDYNAVA